MKRIICVLCLHGSLIFSLLGQRSYDQSWRDCQELGMLESQNCMQGSNIPQFEGETMEGKRINNDSLKGKTVVINFWYMSCPPCIAELDGLNDVADHYADSDSIVFLSFTLDNRADLDKYFFKKYSMKFEIIANAENDIFNIFKIRWGFPTTMVIDKAGQIELITSGGNSDPAIASKNISQTLFESIGACLIK